MTRDWLDLAILAYALLGLWRGLRQGFLVIGFSLAGYLAGVMLASRYHAQATAMVLRQLPLKAWVPTLLPAPVASDPTATSMAMQLAHTFLDWAVFLVLVGLVEVIGRACGRWLSLRLRRFRLLAALNGLGGSLAGVAEHLFIVALAATVAISLPFLRGTPLAWSVDHSVVASTLVEWFRRLANLPAILA